MKSSALLATSLPASRVTIRSAFGQIFYPKPDENFENFKNVASSEEILSCYTPGIILGFGLGLLSETRPYGHTTHFSFLLSFSLPENAKTFLARLKRGASEDDEARELS